MIKRYIIQKEALNLLDKNVVDANETLAKDIVITDECLVFSRLPYASVCLNASEVDLLKSKGYDVKPEERKKGEPTAGNYEKNRSAWRKFYVKNITGRGVKVAVLDTGCNTTHVPCDFTVNYADANPVTNNAGHGTQVVSIIKSSIGLANGCEMHFIKIFDDVTSTTDSVILAAVNYCKEHDIDVMNMSFNLTFPSMQDWMNQLWDDNCIPVGATGNSPTETAVGLPAGLNNVVAVNAVNEDGAIGYKNYLVQGDATHGVTISCSGRGCETITSAGALNTNNGTSFSAPFFCGIFALYKEQLGLPRADNKKVLQHILNKAIKTEPVQYFGAGIITA